MLAALAPSRFRTIEGEDTKSRLAATGERLLGEAGFGVALHEIAHAAGQGNKYAVQYHFGGKDGLIAAIAERREAMMVERRADMIAAARAEGTLGDLKTLVDIIYRPIAEQVDEQGRHSFARFWFQFQARPNAGGLAKHPFRARHPQFLDLLEMLGTVLGTERDQVGQKLQLLSWVVFAALVDRDDQAEAKSRRRSLDAVLERPLAMVESALRGTA